MKTFSYIIVSPKGTEKSGTCSSMIIPSTDGMIGILANHSPFVTDTATGFITIDKEKFGISEGILTFENNKCTIVLN